MVRGFARPDGIGIVTAAAHSLEALDRAAAAGADAALLSPVFQTGSHPDAPALGASEFARLSGLARIPVYALGGITAETVPAIAESGAAGIAVTGAFAS
jgi:thiamine-phosphate pyrophosphorylase